MHVLVHLVRQMEEDHSFLLSLLLSLSEAIKLMRVMQDEMWAPHLILKLGQLATAASEPS